MEQVVAQREPLSIPTYGLGVPEKNPMFFEKRVYQGSNGKVYPAPFIDKVYDTPSPCEYDAVRLESEYVRVVMLPEIGGRIFIGQDKANNDYDFFYRQDVIKPALVGLAGPWLSGGVEFNWPQHHRPGTYMPADVHIEHEPDGARTVWLSEHDPLDRLKGMHGIRVRPGSAVIELRARLYNRTPMTQTFLWWANVAARVHDKYQSFFPPDVNYVADHAVRAQSSFPEALNHYYGIDYADRPGANDLSWYRNIPVPTSYMVCDTRFDFFGGYDHEAGGGFVHVANRHVAPGKKQWTWGNEEFGWAWDRELTDRNGPYVELMAGVYTDNQPDFAYLLPYETKTFSQFWWPYQSLGPVQNASEDIAIRFVPGEGRSLCAGVAASRRIDGVRIRISEAGETLHETTVDLSPEQPWRGDALRFSGDRSDALAIEVIDPSGRSLLSYRPAEARPTEHRRAVATEPLMPEELASSDELYLTAEHLEQYRHPTRSPEPYWEEALKRDPADARTNIAVGRRRLKQGRFDQAELHLRRAIGRLTSRHPNPYTGEAHYFLGVTLSLRDRLTEAYAAFYKATWNSEWRSAAYYGAATIDARRNDWAAAIEHCGASLDTGADNNKAKVLKAIALRRLGEDAQPVLAELLATDPLDHWARYESGDTDGFLTQSRNDAQTILDIVYDYADVGCYGEALKLLALHHRSTPPATATPNPLATSQLTRYAQAWVEDRVAPHAGDATLAEARELAPDYLFPSRLHDQIVLEWAAEQRADDRNAFYGLGNYYYDRLRHEDAIAAWENAREADGSCTTVCRNLGIAYWNVRRDGDAARSAYENARRNDPTDARVLYEHDQLRKKLGDPVEGRLETLLAHRELVDERDDCSVELATLYNDTDQPQKALSLLESRRFHPWEGGEGLVLRQYTRARLLLGEKALELNVLGDALEHFESAMRPPKNLGEAYHLLQAKADVNYWSGRALRALGREDEAVSCFEASANEAGDFQAMAVTEHSELSYYRGLSLIELGRVDEAQALFLDLAAFARQLRASEAKIDYFATSLPDLLVFDDDLAEVQTRRADLLHTLAERGTELVAAAAAKQEAPAATPAPPVDAKRQEVTT